MLLDGNRCRGFDHVQDGGRGVGQFAFDIGLDALSNKPVDGDAQQDDGKDENDTIACQKLVPDTKILEMTRQIEQDVGFFFHVE